MAYGRNNHRKPKIRRHSINKSFGGIGSRWERYQQIVCSEIYGPNWNLFSSD